MALRNVSSDDSRYAFSSDSLSSIRANKEKYNDYASKKKNRTDEISSKSDNLQKLKQLAQKNLLRKSINNPVLQSAQMKGPESYNASSIKNTMKVSDEKLQLPERPPLRLASFSKLELLAQKHSLKKNIENSDSHSVQRKSSKPYNGGGIKNTMKVSSEKLQLPERPLPRIGTSSTSEFYSFKNGQLQNKRNEKDSENYPLSKVIGATKDGCKGESKGVAHIEVFMPVVFSERNIIMYPKSRKPIIKYYPVKENHLLKSKSRNITNRNTQTNLKKPFPQKTEDDACAASNRKTVSSPRIDNERNDCKNVLVKMEPLDRGLGSSDEIEDLLTLKEINETPVLYKDNRDENPQQSMAEKTEHKDYEISNGALEMDCSEINEGINNNRPNSNLNYGTRQDVSQNAMVSESVLGYAESKSGTCWNNVADGLSQLPICDEQNSTNEILFTREENTRSLEHSPKEPNQKELINYNQLYLEKIDDENAITTSLPIQPLVKSKSDENGWSRNIFPISPNTNRCSSSISNRRTDVKSQDELSMETWLDRCKYLQSRKQNLQNDSCEQNNWRNG